MVFIKESIIVKKRKAKNLSIGRTNRTSGVKLKVKITEDADNHNTYRTFIILTELLPMTRASESIFNPIWD